MNILEIIVTLGLGLAGLYLAHGVNRQLRVKTADSRMQAYTALWEAMRVAAPSRDEAMSAAERSALNETMTDWYFSGGHGMLMASGTGPLFLTATRNLVREHDKVEPKSEGEWLAGLPAKEQDTAHGRLSMRQLSLLRTRMKADLAVYGRVYDRDLDCEDKAFLRFCGENLLRRPWRAPWVPWKRRWGQAVLQWSRNRWPRRARLERERADVYARRERLDLPRATGASEPREPRDRGPGE